jgi:hypothetical protein
MSEFPSPDELHGKLSQKKKSIVLIFHSHPSFQIDLMAGGYDAAHEADLEMDREMHGKFCLGERRCIFFFGGLNLIVCCTRFKTFSSL